MDKKEKMFAAAKVFGETLRKHDALGGVSIVLSAVTPESGGLGVESRAMVHGPGEMTDVLVKLAILALVAEFVQGGGRICQKGKACELCAQLWRRWEEATAEGDSGTLH